MRDARTELIKSVLDADIEGVRRLLLAGSSSVDEYDDLGMTALLYAIYRGDREAVMLLLQAGANPNLAQRDDPSATPFWHADQDFGLSDISSLLRNYGAKI